MASKRNPSFLDVVNSDVCDGPNDDELLSRNSSVADEFYDSNYDGLFDSDVTKFFLN
jgi:hypothetical protein